MSAINGPFQDPEEYRQELLKAYMAIKFISGLRLQDLADAQQRADTLGPLLDPTAWMRNRHKMEEDFMVVRQLRKALDGISADVLAKLRQQQG